MCRAELCAQNWRVYSGERGKRTQSPPQIKDCMWRPCTILTLRTPSLALSEGMRREGPPIHWPAWASHLSGLKPGSPVFKWFVPCSLLRQNPKWGPGDTILKIPLLCLAGVTVPARSCWRGQGTLQNGILHIAWPRMHGHASGSSHSGSGGQCHSQNVWYSGCAWVANDQTVTDCVPWVPGDITPDTQCFLNLLLGGRGSTLSPDLNSNLNPTEPMVEATNLI